MNAPMARFVRLLVTLALALAARPALAGPIGEAEADVILGELTTGDVWRCINVEERRKLDKQQVVAVCGAGIRSIDPYRARVPESDKGKHGVIDLLDAMMFTAMADRLIEIDGDISKPACLAIGRSWKLLSFDSYDAFTDDFGRFIKGQRDKAMNRSFACLDRYPGLF